MVALQKHLHAGGARCAAHPVIVLPQRPCAIVRTRVLAYSSASPKVEVASSGTSNASAAAAVSERPVITTSEQSAASTTATLTELNKETFYPYLEEQGNTLVVVDFFTDWCGPCKMMMPQLVKMAQANPDVRIVKFNCNSANKDMALKLGIRVAPTFQLYRAGQKIGELTGAKVSELRELISKHK